MKHKSKVCLSFIVICLLIGGLLILLNKYNKYLDIKHGALVDVEPLDDQIMAVYIDDVLSSSYPTTSNYTATVLCKVNGNLDSSVNASASWNGSKWVLSASNITQGKTTCTSYFYKK